MSGVPTQPSPGAAPASAPDEGGVEVALLGGCCAVGSCLVGLEVSELLQPAGIVHVLADGDLDACYRELAGNPYRAALDAP